MVHKHSVFALQKRAAKRLALTNAFDDDILSEIVNITTGEQLNLLLKADFEFVLPGAITFERGEVLLEPRGEGSLQILPIRGYNHEQEETGRPICQ